MNIEEATRWRQNLSEEQIIKMMMEYHALKQALCARTLLIPTGTEDWIFRAIRRGEQLTECERQLRKLIHAESELLEEAKWRTHFRECYNCMGRKVVSSGNSCSVCDGTGLRHL